MCAMQGDFVVAFLDIVGPELDKPYAVGGDATPHLNHLLRQALLSCSGGVRLDEEANGPMQLLRIDVGKSAGEGQGAQALLFSMCTASFRLFVGVQCAVSVPAHALSATEHVQRS